MEFEALKREIYELAGADQLDKAEQRLLETKGCFQGKSLGRWHHLYAQVIRRLHPEERELFTDACLVASRLLQTDHAELCDLYLTQAAAAMVWHDWNLARTYIRRMRAFFRRYPSNYEIQRDQGLILANEAFIEYVACNFSRAVALAGQGLALMERYVYPPDPVARAYQTTSVLITVAECQLRLGEHARALETLAKIDPASVARRDQVRYCRVNSNYWVALHVVGRAEEWFQKIGEKPDWEPDSRALLLELQAGIARAKGDLQSARQFLQEAIEQASASGNKSLMSIMRHQLNSHEEDLKE